MRICSFVEINKYETLQNWINFAEHQNWFGLDDNLGPVAISIRREKVPTSALFIAGSSANNVNNNGGGNISNGGNVSSMENGSSGSSSLAPSIGEKEQFMYRIMVSIFLLELI